MVKCSQHLVVALLVLVQKQAASTLLRCAMPLKSTAGLEICDRHGRVRQNCKDGISHERGDWSHVQLMTFHSSNMNMGKQKR